MHPHHKEAKHSRAEKVHRMVGSTAHHTAPDDKAQQMISDNMGAMQQPQPMDTPPAMPMPDQGQMPE